MPAPVEDVQLRHRQLTGMGPAQIAVQGQADPVGRGLAHRQGDPQNGVGPELALVFGAVQFDQGGVDGHLVGGVGAGDLRGDDGVDVRHRPADSPAEEAVHIPVAQLDRLEGPRGRARRYGRPAQCAVVENDVDLDGGVAA